MIHMMLLMVEIVIHTCIYHIYTPHTHWYNKGLLLYTYCDPLYEASGSRVRVQSAGGGWDADPEPLLGVDINIKR